MDISKTVIHDITGGLDPDDPGGVEIFITSRLPGGPGSVKTAMSVFELDELIDNLCLLRAQAKDRFMKSR